MQNKIKKNNKQNSQLIQIGFLLILFGMFIFNYQFFYKNKVKAYQRMNQKLYEHKNQSKTEHVKQEEISPIPTESVDKNGNKKEEVNINTTYAFIGYLEIPTIHFKQGFVDKNDVHNNVEENITILKEATYPDKVGNFIIAGHSGTGAIAYFNELYRLKEHDTMYVYYKNKKYTYEIVNIYTQPKNGTIKIYRDQTKATVTLITCTNDNDTTQTVYIANQIAVTND